MNTTKGIVFEKTTSYSIFLTPDGLFQRGIPLSTTVEIGEEVFFHPYSEVRKRKISYNTSLTTPLISMVAIIVLFFSVLLPSQTRVSAFVQIDVNPSIELGIDNNGAVQLFRGLNEDGMNVKRDISFWKGKPLSSVLLEIVERTESVIAEAETLEITTIYQENVDHDSLEKAISTAVSTSTTEIEIKKQEIKVIEATIEDRNAANTEGISVRKYQAGIEKETKSNNKEKKQVQPKGQSNNNNPLTPHVEDKNLKEQKDLKKDRKVNNNQGSSYKDKKQLDNKAKKNDEKRNDNNGKNNNKPDNNRNSQEKQNDKSSDNTHRNNDNGNSKEKSKNSEDNNKNNNNHHNRNNTDNSNDNKNNSNEKYNNYNNNEKSVGKNKDNNGGNNRKNSNDNYRDNQEQRNGNNDK